MEYRRPKTKYVCMYEEESGESGERTRIVEQCVGVLQVRNGGCTFARGLINGVNVIGRDPALCRKSDIIGRLVAGEITAHQTRGQ